MSERERERERERKRYVEWYALLYVIDWTISFAAVPCFKQI